MDFPNNRLTYSGKKGPIFDDEIQNALNGLYKSVNLLLGLGPTDFAILSGFTYTPGTPGSYSGGFVYMSGVIYYCDAGVNVGQYLIPSISQIENKPHSDGVSRYVYQVFYAVASNTSGSGGSPIFTTTMDNYRLNISLAKSQAIATAASDSEIYTDTIVNNLIGELGGAAYKDIGTVSNTVAAGDDSRINGAIQTSSLDAAWTSFTLVESGGYATLNSSTVSFLKIGKIVFMNIRINFTMTSIGISGPRFNESGTTYASLRGNIKFGAGCILSNTSGPSSGSILIDNNSVTKFGLNVHNSNGTELTNGETYDVNATIVYGSL